MHMGWPMIPRKNHNTHITESGNGSHTANIWHLAILCQEALKLPYFEVNKTKWGKFWSSPSAWMGSLKRMGLTEGRNHLALVVMLILAWILLILLDGLSISHREFYEFYEDHVCNYFPSVNFFGKFRWQQSYIPHG